MPFPFDFFNMVRRPEDLMRTADFNPDARKLPVPVPVPVPGPAPVPVLPPAPIARPQMPVPMANPVPAVPLTPEMKQGLEMKQPPASYALMKDTFTGGAAPLDRQTVRMMEKQYVDEQSQRKGAGRFFRNLGAGALAGLEGGGAIGALTGAATGAIGGAISPKFGARLQYGAFERPNVERAYGQQQAEQMMQMKQALDLAKLAQERSQQMKYEAEAERASRPVLHNATPEQNVFGIGPDGNPSVIYRGQSKPQVQRPVSVAPGATLYDPATRRPIFTAPEKPGSDVLSPEQAAKLAEDEVTGIRGSLDAELPKFRERLRPQFEQMYGITPEVKAKAATPGSYASEQVREFEKGLTAAAMKLREEEHQRNISAKKGANIRYTQTQKGNRGASGPTINVNDLSKYPGLQ